MKILSNEYRSNVPGESAIAHGGPANFASAFSDFAAGRGHDWIGVIQSGHDSEKTSVTKISNAGKKTYFACRLPNDRMIPFLQLRRKQDSSVYFSEEIDALRRFIRKVQPDVLFLNGYSVFSWILLQAASEEGVPIVNQHAGIARVEFEQYRHLYSRAGMDSMLRMERDIVGTASVQIFLNAYSRDAFSKIVATVPKKSSRVIPLPYSEAFARDASRRNRGLAGKDANGIVIGCVARWDRIKNHKALLSLAREARRLGLPWKFKSVTNIPETKFAARFKAAYRREIEVVAPMEQSELPTFYRSVDALVLPSHFDVSPTVVMEAALLRKATLISPGVGWNSEYREYGLENWIMDFSDPGKVVRRLRRLLREPPASRFREMIRTRHAPRTIFSAYLKAFEDARRLNRE